jgi:LTXXQ motif family protein
MNTRNPALAALALATALAGGVGFSTLSAQNAAAQATTAPQQTQEPERHHSASRHIDGRIAYLKAELKITDAQAPQFERVAQAMRQSAQSRDQAMQQMRANRDQPKTAVQRLEARTQFAALRAQDSQRFLDAFKPLYASLSDDQKKAADELLSRGGHRGGHEHGRM